MIYLIVQNNSINMLSDKKSAINEQSEKFQQIENTKTYQTNQKAKKYND